MKIRVGDGEKKKLNLISKFKVNQPKRDKKACKDSIVWDMQEWYEFFNRKTFT